MSQTSFLKKRALSSRDISHDSKQGKSSRSRSSATSPGFENERKRKLRFPFSFSNFSSLASRRGLYMHLLEDCQIEPYSWSRTKCLWHSPDLAALLPLEKYKNAESLMSSGAANPSALNQFFSHTTEVQMRTPFNIFRFLFTIRKLKLFVTLRSSFKSEVFPLSFYQEVNR